MFPWRPWKLWLATYLTLVRMRGLYLMPLATFLHAFFTHTHTHKNLNYAELEFFLLVWKFSFYLHPWCVYKTLINCAQQRGSSTPTGLLSFLRLLSSNIHIISAFRPMMCPDFMSKQVSAMTVKECRGREKLLITLRIRTPQSWMYIS